MKKLYVIRNKETGGIYRHTFVPIYTTREGVEFYIREKLNSEKYEPVTLRIEPAEPCEWCGDDIGGSIHRPNNGHEKEWRKDAVRVSLGYYHFNFCPNCGRRLE